MMSMQKMQQAAHDCGHDYANDSPHIKHYPLRSMVVEATQQVIRNTCDRKGACQVVEVGAGHGTFTDHLVAAGASVEVTEMSWPSVEELGRRFRHNRSVTVRHDRDGSVAASGAPVDVVACISVLHHIPDYLSAVSNLVERISVGGSFVSFQDPLWYARRSKWSLGSERAAYLLWRVRQGDLRRGITTTSRRLRGILDESNPADMVEYHVVRKGLDEEALLNLLRLQFETVEIIRYWSTQGSLPQAVGARLLPPNTFAILASGRLARS